MPRQMQTSLTCALTEWEMRLHNERPLSAGQSESSRPPVGDAGASLKLLLFGDAHQSHSRESEGSIMAICNARMSGQGRLCWKLQDASSIYKLGTSADYALCGAKTKVAHSSWSPHALRR